MDLSPDRIVQKLACLETLTGVDSKGIRLLARYGRPLLLRRGKALFYQSDPADRAFLLLSGTVDRLKYRADETATLIGRPGPGEWLGLSECFLDTPYLVDGLTASSCSVLSYTQESLYRLLRTGDLTAYFFRVLSRTIQLLHGQLELNQPFYRLVHFIVSRSRPEGTGYVLRITQEQIAQAIGVSRETVNRHLRDLQNAGQIRVGRGCVRTASLEELEDMII